MLVCLTLGQALCAASVLAGPAAPDPDGFEAAIVAVTLNGTARGDLFVHRGGAGRLMLRRQDLPAIGLQVNAPTVVLIDGAEHVALDGIPGLTLTLDEPSQSLAITAPVNLLARTVIEAGSQLRTLRRVAGEGAFLNWALEQTLEADAPRRPLSLALEGGARLGPALLLSRGQTVNDGVHTRFVRLATSLTHDLPDRQARWTLGDLATTPDELGQGMVLGGLSYATLARLDPYRIRYPLGTVQGQALTPSEVDVYVDGQRVRTERVPAGVFEIRDLQTALGARAVQLRVRDAYGRVQRFDQTLYATPRLLAPGLHDFQYVLGVVREGLGQTSSDYGAAVVSARHAWAATPDLTLGLRAEGRAGFATAGASAVWRVASWGLLTASLASSHAQRVRGQAGLLRYEYQSTAASLGLAYRADSVGYAALADAPVRGNRLRETQVYASRVIGEGRSVWISHNRRTTRPGPQALPEGWRYAPLAASQGTSIGFAAYLRPWGGSLRVTASRLEEAGRSARHALTASLVFLLDGGGVLATQWRRDTDSRFESVQWSRPAPALGGWAFDVGATHAQHAPGSTAAWRTAAQLESSAVRLRGELNAEENPDRHALRLSAAGAFTFLGGRVHHSRPVDDSFAMVQVGELAGVPVSVNGAPAGMTDARGQLLLPRISAHQDTVIGLDAQALPIDQTVSDLQQRVVLPERSGAVIRFDVRRLRALAAQLTSQGRPLARARVWIGSGAQAVEALTGPQGELYLENLPLGAHHGVVEHDRGHCRFDFVVPRHEEPLLELGVLACAPQTELQNRSDGPR